MVKIVTELFPFRLAIKRREPVSLKIEITNDTEKPQIISYEVALANELGFEKQGLNNVQTKQIDSMKPGEMVREYYKIFPKVTARAGEYPIRVTVTEHYNSFNYVLGRKVKTLSLIVE
ncbi:MAG: hypothetical protein NTZ73_02445 [Candidatus Diapherotrites archaeon]|nr:hypothetical protein [Candidatus Diapherotrites archaeon]